MEIKISPISVNKAWQGKRFKTREYSAWRDSFLWLCPKQEPVLGNVQVFLQFYVKNDTRADLDNFLKTTLDGLTEKGLIEDDRKIRRIILEKYHSEEEKIVAYIEPWTFIDDMLYFWRWLTKQT